MDAKRLLGYVYLLIVVDHAVAGTMDAKWLLGRAGESVVGQGGTVNTFYSYYRGCEHQWHLASRVNVINERPKWFDKGCTKWFLHSEAELSRVADKQTDRLTDTAHIGNNSLHLMHSMQPNNCLVVLWCVQILMNVASLMWLVTTVKTRQAILPAAAIMATIFIEV